MGGICQGEELQMEGLMPDWMESLGKDIIGYLQQPQGAGSRFTQPATALPEGFPLTSPVDPLSLGGANIMSQLMGSGQYQQPPPGSFNYQMPGTSYMGGDIETGIGDEPPLIPFDPNEPPPWDIGFSGTGAGVPFENPPEMGGPPPIQPPPILPPNIMGQLPQAPMLPPPPGAGVTYPPILPPDIMGQFQPPQAPLLPPPGSF